MKISLLLAFMFLSFSFQSFSQREVNWDWRLTDSLDHKDLEYKSGFLYTTGKTTTGVFLKKVDTSGNVIWQRNFTGAAQLENLAVNNNGDICAVGSMTGTMTVGANVLASHGNRDMLIISLTATGNLNFASNPGSTDLDSAIDVAADNANNFYVLSIARHISFAGRISPTYATAVLKYNASGVETDINWLKPSRTNTGYFATSMLLPYSIKFSAVDNALVFSGLMETGGAQWGDSITITPHFPVPSPIDTTYFNVISNTANTMFLEKIDTSLDNIYGRVLDDGSWESRSRSTDMAIDNNGNAYLVSWAYYRISGNFFAWLGSVDVNGVTSSFHLTLATIEQFSTQHIVRFPYKMSYNSTDNTLYGGFYSNDDCGGYKAFSYDLTTAKYDYIKLRSRSEFVAAYGVAGNNRQLYIADNASINKAKQTIAPLELLNHMRDTIACPGGWLYLGLDQCDINFKKGGMAPYKYSWTRNGTLIPNNSSQIVATLTNFPQTYTFTVTDSLGQQVSDTVNLIPLPHPERHIYDTICSGYYSFGNSNYNYYPGIYYQNKPNPAGGCDSLIILHLSVINRSVCPLVDATWENPANWTCGSIPSTNTDVVITCGNWTINSNVVINSLQVLPGASVTVTPGHTLTLQSRYNNP